MAQKEHLNLLIKREGKVVLGKHCFNLWLLTAVLVATFTSVAFSNGSLLYLSEKMNDPFTQWVNIENRRQGNEDDLHSVLMNDSLQQHYGFNDVQADSEQGLLMFRNHSDHTDYLQVRFFERMNSPLMEKVLDDDNVVMNKTINPELLRDDMLGFIITRDALEKMGYSMDSVPMYIHLYSKSDGIDSLVSRGIVLDKDSNMFYRVPLPVLAVVRRLPMNMSMASSKYFLGQYYTNLNGNSPLSMTREDYFKQLLYFVSEGYEEKFLSNVYECVPDSLKKGRTAENIALTMEEESLENRLRTWKPGRIYQICVEDGDAPIQAYEDIAYQIEQRMSSVEICRVFDYKVGKGSYQQFSFLSLNFCSLDSIRAFEKYVKNEFKVQVEMSQVESKENFNEVSIMAHILSWAMIIFAIVCIIIFLVNMLQSYFQKVKRNLGTFKAFGISSSELTRVYVVIILAIIFVAIVSALLLTYIAQVSLSWMGIMKDGTFDYLSLWETNTFLAIAIIIVATLVTVKLVMNQLMKQTPGDLIYDRN